MNNNSYAQDLGLFSEENIKFESAFQVVPFCLLTYYLCSTRIFSVHRKLALLK